MEKDFVQLPAKQVMLAMLGVMLAMFMAALGQTVVATAMPVIIADLGGFDRYTWAAIAYLVAATVSIPIVGRLTDLYGRKVFLVLGIVIFIGGSIPAGMSQTMNQLIAFRAIQGIGGGTIMAYGFLVTADLFPPEVRGRYQGLISLVYGVASVIGPTLGGIITDVLSWNWIFFINIPIGIPILLLIIRTFPPIRPEVQNRSLDYLGMVTLALSVIPILIALSIVGVYYAWDTPQVIGFLAFGLVMTAIFAIVESKAVTPIMPFEIYRFSVVAVSTTVAFLAGFGLYGTIIFLPLFFQGVLGASPTSSGGFLTPLILGIVFGAIVSGRMLAKRDGRFRRQALISTGLMALGMYLISTMDVNISSTAVVGYVVIMALGLGGVLATFNLAVQNAVPFRLVGTATSALLFYRLIGGTLGLAVLGVVMTHRFSARVEETVSDAVRAALGPGQLDAIKDNPRVLIDPAALDVLRAEFAEMGTKGAQMADALLGTLHSALAEAVGDVFAIGVVVVALSVVLSLFLKVAKGDSQSRLTTSSPGA